MSVAAVARKTGIAKPNLSRLACGEPSRTENSEHTAPTLDTLERYARAVGMTIQIELAAADAA
jgi:transcriptional regulator with XRE-family HTH domain